jgi:hypothetical protein
MLDRRGFLRQLASAAAGVGALPAVQALGAQQQQGGRSAQQAGAPRSAASSGPRSHEFVFARLRYDSGDWDYNPKVCANVLDAVVQYTNIPIYQTEVVITADAKELPSFPFLFMTGHKLVRFSEAERNGIVRFVESGGLLFSDDCNHDIDGLYARSFEEEMRKAFPPQGSTDPMPRIPNNHRLYSTFFRFDGPPQTSHELNGWGDDIVHDYMRGIERKGRLGVIYSNKDYGCEWDYDWRNKRFRAQDNTRFAVNLVVYCMVG